MEIIKYPSKETYKDILQRPVFDNKELENTVLSILQEVKMDGDKAVQKYSLKFDGVDLDSMKVSGEEFLMAEILCTKELKDALLVAKNNIEKFHLSQHEEIKKVEVVKGVECWRKSVAIEKVGLYIPGGTAPLISTVLMLAIPAKIAGSKEIVLCTPPARDGSVNPAILYAAKLCGVDNIYKIGGIQAIGGMAYGTETIPQVYKLFGPGNQYVTCAKQLVSKDGTAIDMPAGPSELLVLADDTCVPEFVAADLLSQAEHGADSQVVLVSSSQEVIKNVLLEVDKQVEKLPRVDTAKKALENSKAILVKDVDEAMELINEYAPEHLVVACENLENVIDKIVNAGSVFLGNYASESSGDYASGTNHTLPTNGYAKAYSGVSLDSFVKKITFQQLSAEGVKNIGPAIEIIAEAEQLQAHKNAVSIRLKSI